MTSEVARIPILQRCLRKPYMSNLHTVRRGDVLGKGVHFQTFNSLETPQLSDKSYVCATKIVEKVGKSVPDFAMTKVDVQHQ
jgi:hypothetical protein